MDPTSSKRTEFTGSFTKELLHCKGLQEFVQLPQNYGSKMILVGRNLTINRFLKFQELNHFHCK